MRSTFSACDSPLSLPSGIQYSSKLRLERAICREPGKGLMYAWPGSAEGAGAGLATTGAAGGAVVKPLGVDADLPAAGLAAVVVLATAGLAAVAGLASAAGAA